MNLKEKISFITTFENGVIHQPPHSFLILLKYEPSKVAVTIEPIRSNRSLNQLAYLWGQVYPRIAYHTGHTPTELHEIYKRLLLPPQILKWRGREIKIPGSSTKLSKGEMAGFITRVIAEAAQMGITVPPADPTKSAQRLDA